MDDIFRKGDLLFLCDGLWWRWIGRRARSRCPRNFAGRSDFMGFANGAAAGRRISFYNQNDFALAMPRWGFDQITKPDYIPPNNFYYYGGSLSDPAPWNHFYDSPIVGGAGSLVDIVANLNNHYKIMAYAAEPRSTALGATPGVSTITRNLDLTTVWPTDTSGHSYADHFWHSAEFRGDCWQEWGYWNTLLFSSQYGFNISNP